MARTAKKETALNPEEKLAQALISETEQPYSIPENWCWTKMTTVAQWGSGGTPSRKKPEYYEGSIPWIKTGELNDDYVYETEEHITQNAILNSSAKLFPVNTIAIAMYGATIGKVGILGVEATTNQACACGVSTPALLYKYLFYYARSQKEAFIGKAKGGAQPNISQDIIKNHAIPLPPLSEQQRIVARIESLFAKLDEAKEKAQAVVDGAKERKTSLLFQAFTGKLTEQWRAQNEGKYSIDDWLEYEDDVVAQSECPTDLPASWKWIRMGAVGYTNIGLTYSPSDKSDDGIIVLRSSNIQNGKMDYEDIVRVNMSIPDNKMCRKGDLLICARNGSKALVGKTAVVDADGMSYGAFMAIFRSVYNSYIYYFLSSPFFRDLIDKDVGTTTINQVTQAIIKNLPLPFAPKEEQNEVVRILSGLLDKEDTIIETATRAIDQIEGIKKSILARAFRGELGTNDPTDESAEELLKRIL